MKKKQIAITLVALICLIAITVGVTYAFFSYMKDGIKENTITSGKITFHYEEGSRSISLNDALPMTDKEGKEQDNYFEFKVTSDTSDTINIPYYITARNKANSDDLDDIVKVYLTKVDNVGNEEEVILSKYSLLNQYVNSDIDISNHTEKLIYTDRVLAGTREYNQKYRLRMWIADDSEFIKQENGETTYPYQGKTFTLTINVYSNGSEVTQSDIENASNVEVTKVKIDNAELEKSESSDYDYYAILGKESAQIEIETENPYATVKIEKTESDYETLAMSKSNIKRLSTRSVVALESGDNYFRINIKSEDKTEEKTLKVKIMKLVNGENLDIGYTGHEEVLNILTSGKYKLETWGAQGGSYNSTYYGGYGGYSAGDINLNNASTLYINVGGAGSFTNSSNKTVLGGYNGGTEVVAASDDDIGSGGGATHIALVSGLLSKLSEYIGEYNSTTGTYESEKILIVAGGGGGAVHWYNKSNNYSYGRGGSGGGYIGVDGYTVYKLSSSSFAGNGGGGTQTTGGTPGRAKASWGIRSDMYGVFGAGGFYHDFSNGGGGFYGGGAGAEVGAGGGSGYIGNLSLENKYMYCYGCQESTGTQIYTISTTGESSERDTTNCPNGYSSDPISKCAKEGNGYARITYIGE